VDCQAGRDETTDETELFAEVATRLKEAHMRVRRLDVPDGAKVALVRRLLVITDAAKHDLRDAARRLVRFMDELDAGPVLRSDTAGAPNPLRHKGDSPVR
jgi:hypothetical protein